MTENLPINHDTEQQPPSRAWLLLHWAFTTAVVAWLAPYAVIALVAAICGLFGVTTDGVRMNVVGLATFRSDEWSAVGFFWRAFVWSSGGAVVLWRTCNSWVVRTKLAALNARFVPFVRFGDAAERVLDPFVARLERLPRAVQAGIFVVGMATFLLCLASLPSSERPQRPAVPMSVAPMPAPQPSAALVLPGGLIRSGDATVQQRDRDTYVVTFTAAATH